jgi:hypothetical protein
MTTISPRHYKDIDFSRGSKNQIKDFENGNAAENEDGTDNAVWSTAPAEPQLRVVLTNRLLEEADGSTSAKSAKWPRMYFCRQCGAMHRGSSNKCLADGCKHPEPLLPMLVFGPQVTTCPSCSTPAYRIGGRVIEPIRKVQAVTVSDVHIPAEVGR